VATSLTYRLKRELVDFLTLSTFCFSFGSRSEKIYDCIGRYLETAADGCALPHAGPTYHAGACGRQGRGFRSRRLGADATKAHEQRPLDLLGYRRPGAARLANPTRSTLAHSTAAADAQSGRTAVRRRGDCEPRRVEFRSRGSLGSESVLHAALLR